MKKKTGKVKPRISMEIEMGIKFLQFETALSLEPGGFIWKLLSHFAITFM